VKYSHDSIASIYDPLTDAISLYQTVKTKNYLLKKIKRNSKVLVVACGNGNLAITARKKGCEVVGLDISKKMIKNAKKASKKNNVRGIKFIQGDFLLFYTNEKFDYVVLAYFLNIFPDEKCVEIILEKAKSHLKPEGYFLIADEMDPMNPILSFIVNTFRILVFTFFHITTGIKHHKIHNLPRVMKRLNLKLIEEKRFLFQYCSVIVGKV
jgi:ubiquinone/menaquinone biosynthesis C-methylase UbiE